MFGFQSESGNFEELLYTFDSNGYVASVLIEVVRHHSFFVEDSNDDAFVGFGN